MPPYRGSARICVHVRVIPRSVRILGKRYALMTDDGRQLNPTRRKWGRELNGNSLCSYEFLISPLADLRRTRFSILILIYSFRFLPGEQSVVKGR